MFNDVKKRWDMDNEKKIHTKRYVVYKEGKKKTREIGVGGRKYES